MDFDDALRLSLLLMDVIIDSEIEVDTCIVDRCNTAWLIADNLVRDVTGDTNTEENILFRLCAASLGYTEHSVLDFVREHILTLSARDLTWLSLCTKYWNDTE